MSTIKDLNNLHNLFASGTPVVNKDAPFEKIAGNVGSTAGKGRILFSRKALLSAFQGKKATKKPVDNETVLTHLLTSLNKFTSNAKVWKAAQNDPRAMHIVFSILVHVRQEDVLDRGVMTKHLEDLTKWRRDYKKPQTRSHASAGPAGIGGNASSSIPPTMQFTATSFDKNEPNVAPVLGALASMQFSNIVKNVSIALRAKEPTTALANQLGTLFGDTLNTAFERQLLTEDQLEGWLASNGANFKAQIREALKSSIPDLMDHDNAVKQFLDDMYAHTCEALVGVHRTAPGTPLLVSKSTQADGTERAHYWGQYGKKQGGVHSAGPKGGVDILLNEKKQPVDLKGSRLNVLDKKGRAKDLHDRVFTVMRDDNNEIWGVRYLDPRIDPQSILVTMDKATGELKDDATNTVIAKLDKAQLGLVKKEERIPKTITEQFGAELFRSIYHDLFPEVHYIDATEPGKPRTADDIYVVSIFFENYKWDGFKEMYHRDGAPIPEQKPLLDGITEESRIRNAKGIFLNNEDHQPIRNLPEVTITPMLGDNSDGHFGNVGIKGENEAVRLDLAGTLRKICKHPTIRPNSNSAHPIGFGPLNRHAQLPLETKITPESVAVIDANVAHNYDPAIDKALKEAAKHYDAKAFRELADWVGIEANELPADRNNRDALIETISKRLKEAYKIRQIDLARYSAQLKLDLCADHAKPNVDPEKVSFGSYYSTKGKRMSFTDVVIQHQPYFREVIANPQMFKFRDKSHAHLEDAVIVQARKIIEAIDK